MVDTRDGACRACGYVLPAPQSEMRGPHRLNTSSYLIEIPLSASRAPSLDAHCESSLVSGFLNLNKSRNDDQGRSL